MKIRYIVKNKHTGNIHKKVYTLNQIQNKGLSALFDIENYNIISIDRCLGIILMSNKSFDVFENDIVSHQNWPNRLVCYQEKYCRFILKDVQNREMKINDFAKEFLNVVGNIHENSDLFNFL